MRQQLKLWDSKRERKLTGQTHCQPFAEQRDRASSEEPAGCGPAQPRQRQEAEGRRKGQTRPQRRIPYHTANRPPVSNQRLPEILDGRHPLGGSQLNTRRTHPTSRRKQAGTTEGRRRTAPGESAAPQAPGCLNCSGRGRHKTQAQPSPRFCGVPENWNCTQRRARSL